MPVRGIAVTLAMCAALCFVFDTAPKGYTDKGARVVTTMTTVPTNTVATIYDFSKGAYKILVVSVGGEAPRNANVDAVSFTVDGIELSSGNGIALRFGGKDASKGKVIQIGSIQSPLVLEQSGKSSNLKSGKKVTLGGFAAKASWQSKKKRLTVKLTKGDITQLPYTQTLTEAEKKASETGVDFQWRVQVVSGNTATEYPFENNLTVKSTLNSKKGQIKSQGKSEVED